MSLDLNNIDIELLTKAVDNLGFKKSFSITDGEYEVYGETDFPAEDDVELEFNKLISEIDSTKYREERRDKYPSIGDQLDMIYHAGLGGDEFQAAIKAVKDAYPKPK